LSTIGNAILSPAFVDAEFDAIIIDESTNIAEALIIALISRFSRNLTRLVMIGDPVQLPPVVQAPTLSELPHQVALTFFQRMELTGVPAQLLNVQYRMEPDIAAIIHKSGGYCSPDGNSLLTDHESTFNRPARTQFVEWSRSFKLWGPKTNTTSLALDITDSVLLIKRDGTSKANHHHAVAVLQLAKSLLQFGIKPGDLMVIAMYKSQVALIKRLFQYTQIDVRVVHVNTVDSSEGKETEVCIVDPTTPARNRNELGFLTDKRRINVALSRAKNGRVTLGSMPAL
jgi:superfamily I DNA and/or RNA helicase